MYIEYIIGSMEGMDMYVVSSTKRDKEQTDGCIGHEWIQVERIGWADCVKVTYWCAYCPAVGIKVERVDRQGYWMAQPKARVLAGAQL